MADPEGVRLVNISLTHSGTAKSSDTPLGAVVIAKQEWRGLRLPELRSVMKHQLPQVLPDRFVFLTSERFKIPQTHERCIHSHQVYESSTHIIYIQHSYDLPKLAVQCLDGSQRLGHVYCAYNCTLSDIRDDIKTKCLDPGGLSRSFSFVWPDGPLVLLGEESSTPVHEVLCREEIQVQIFEGPCVEDAFDAATLVKRKSHEPLQNGRRKSIRLSFASNKDMDRSDSQVSELPALRNLGVSKQLLISYVRAEAAPHALMLKKSLTQIGFSVYLDVDEIKSGLDWQDALNYAVSNCEVFIPLVTPRYGETQWTNREVKLADVLGKSILPISFLDDWPPRCLAIQFATTQYICWKPQEQIEEELREGKEEAKDIRIWSEMCIDCVAREIQKRLKNLRIGVSSMSKPALRRIKTLLKTFAGRLPASATPVIGSQDGEENPGPTVVICAHYEDAALGFKVRHLLETAGHSVWMSCVRAVSPEADETAVGTAYHKMTEADLTASDTCDGSSKPGTVLKKLQEEFQEMVDKASVVVFILSQSSAFSKFCSQQVFYCEHRKQILPLLHGEFEFPGWMKMLIKSQRCLRVNSDKFRAALLNQVKRALDPTAKNCLDSDNREANIALAANYLKKNLDIEHCVYVSGSAMSDDPRVEAICRCIGTELARLGDVHLVSSGSYGTSDRLSQVFHQECGKLSRESKLWHVLPERDPKDRSQHYNQCVDSTFALKDFGQTLFCGNSVWEKEAIVGRCFRVCLLVVGGSYSSHEVEEFVWSDRIVVMVNCPECSLVGDLKASAKLSQLPPGVDEADWKCLNDRTQLPGEVGAAVARVVSGLLRHFQSENMTTPHPSELSTPLLSDQPSAPPPLSRKSTLAPVLNSDTETLSAATSTTDLTFSNGSSLGTAGTVASLQKVPTLLMKES